MGRVEKKTKIVITIHYVLTKVIFSSSMVKERFQKTEQSIWVKRATSKTFVCFLMRSKKKTLSDCNKTTKWEKLEFSCWENKLYFWRKKNKVEAKSKWNENLNVALLLLSFSLQQIKNILVKCCKLFKSNIKEK